MAERESKQADLVKQIKRPAARLSEQERHKRKIAALKAKAAPTIIAYKTDKHHFRHTPYVSDDRPGPATPSTGYFNHTMRW